MRTLSRSFLWFLKKVLPWILLILGLAFLWARFLPISTTPYMWNEGQRLGSIKYEWISIEELPPFVASSVIAAEDSGFCAHAGVEWDLLWEVIQKGAQRGASTISQQMVKNLWLWHGDSRFSKQIRKAIEIPTTLLVELLIPKRRIMEIYLNIVEFDEGVFGIEAASMHHFGHSSQTLSREEMARLTAVLPNPAAFQAVPPDGYVQKRAPRIKREARDVEIRALDECVR